MDDKIRCQSCGMPITEEYYGTMADGTKNPEYCQFCFQDGEFTNPEMSVDEMMNSSVSYMTANLGFTEEKALHISSTIIPNLKRWQ